MPPKKINTDYYENDQVDQFLADGMEVDTVEIRHTLSVEHQLADIAQYIQDFLDEPDEEMVFALHIGEHFVGVRLFLDQNDNKVLQYLDPLGHGIPNDLEDIFSNDNLTTQVLKTRIQHSTDARVSNNHCGPLVIFLLTGLTNNNIQLDDDGHIWLNSKRIPNLNYSESNQLGLSIRECYENGVGNPVDLLTQIQLKNHYSAALYHDVIHAQMKGRLIPNTNAMALRSQTILPPDISKVGNIVVAYVEIELQFSAPIGTTRLSIPIDTGTISFSSANNKNLSLTFQKSCNDDKKIGGTGKPNQKHFHSEPMLFQYLKSTQGLTYISEHLADHLRLLNNEDLKRNPKFIQNPANQNYLQKLRAAKEIKLLDVYHVGVYFHTTQSMCSTCQDTAYGDGINPGFAANYINLIADHLKNTFGLTGPDPSISMHPGYTTTHKSPQRVVHVSRDQDLKASPVKPSKFNVGIVSEIVPHSPPRPMDFINKQGTFDFSESPHTFFSNKGSDTSVKKAFAAIDYKKAIGSKEEANANRAASRVRSTFLKFLNKKADITASDPSAVLPKPKL